MTQNSRYHSNVCVIYNLVSPTKISIQCGLVNQFINNMCFMIEYNSSISAPKFKFKAMISFLFMTQNV